MLKNKHLILIILIMMLHTASFGHSAGSSERYLYEDTKQLVSLVENAAGVIEAKGNKAFPEFGIQGSRWLNNSYYLFIYDLDGNCVFHPITPQLIGRNLIHLKDMDGKPLIRMITDIGGKPEKNASGWVFYLWEEQTQFTPLWKSSYIRKAVAPDGKTYVVGCGMYNIKMEKAFIKERIDLAAELLMTRGKDFAFARLRDNASPFYFLDTYVFVMDDKGQSVVDPAFPGMHRDMTAFRDALGRPVVKEVLQKLANKDEAWIQYMLPKPGGILPSRKVGYFRKVRVGMDVFVVGADFFLASPIWMKK